MDKITTLERVIGKVADSNTVLLGKTDDSDSHILTMIKDLIGEKKIELIILDEVNSGTAEETLLYERIRAGGAGIPALYMENDEETLQTAIKGDVAIIKALTADKEGNCRLPFEHRNDLYLALSGKFAIVLADEICEIGEIDPEYVHVPGLLVNAIVQSQSKESN